MKSKTQKREEASLRIKKEIDEIESKPEHQRSDWRLRRLKGEYYHLKGVSN